MVEIASFDIYWIQRMGFYMEYIMIPYPNNRAGPVLEYLFKIFEFT